MESKLPENWVETDLETILARITNGSSLKQSEVAFEGSYPISRIETIWNESIDLKRVKYVKPTEQDLSKYKLEKGDVLFSHINSDKHLGKTAVFNIEETVIHGINLLLLRSIKNYDGKLLNYLLRHYRFSGKFIDVAQRSVNQSSINQKKLKSFNVPLPPLAEQERIVAKLDALFGSLEQVKTRMEKIPQLLKNFRQAILTQAVTGKLTEEWRKGKELEDMTEFVRELSTKRKTEYQKAVVYAKANKLKKPKKDYEFDFEKHLSRNSWCIAKLENLIYMSARIGWKGLKADEYTKEGPMFLSVHGLNYGENVNYDVAYHITQERYDESPEIKLQENDILLCKDGAGIGKLGIVKNLKEPATVNSSLLVIRGREALNYKYLYYFFAGPSLQTIAKERITGTAIPHLFQKDIKEFRLEIPSLKEQTEIVKRVESLFVKADKIEEKYLALKQQIDSLPQAILAKAFKGELVEQLPTDGNAADLLKEIQELKATTETTKKKKK